MESVAKFEGDLKATELRLGLPGVDNFEKQKVPAVRGNKRSLDEAGDDTGSNSNSIISDARDCDRESAPAAKQQVVGWPPVRSYRKNSFQSKRNDVETSGAYIKVSMDGAPYLRKIDLKIYKGYPELLKALMAMFKFTIGQYSESEGYNGSEYVPTYEDKDGDWMLVGDVPWEMFITSCKRLRIMKGSEAKGLGSGL
ncbi:hypothetical protein AQUCO_04900075v1 [Aquilegia coerulea]|uniref:Auxin-responsive protein n=1 Tax=Aquilegia coerulea TaxID=218851 RepID=A0A2G5CJQ3_AQUCA|nr:hypothetical protein AQUCO_04900075v1 [Aquilegia coerulea]